MGPTARPEPAAPRTAPPTHAAAVQPIAPEPELDAPTPPVLLDPPAPSAPPAPLFLGRFDMSQPEGPRFSWSGSAIVVRFTGPSVSITIEDNGWNWFDVVIDGETRAPLGVKHGIHTYVLAEGLGDGEHVLRFARRNEAHGGITRFRGFGFAEGHGMLSPPPRPQRRVEFIGDSITCGFGTAADHPCPFEYRTENHETAFGAIAARELGAEGHTVCWSGWGMVRGADGSWSANVPAVYGRTMHKWATPTWDAQSWQPHAVVIALGTNDFGAGDPGDLYTNAYASFLARLRTTYPDALLVGTTSPMLYGGQKARQRELIDRAFERRRAQGDGKLAVVDFASQTFDGMGCGGHPGKKTQAAMAAKLVPVLRETLDWKD